MRSYSRLVLILSLAALTSGCGAGGRPLAQPGVDPHWKQYKLSLSQPDGATSVEYRLLIRIPPSSLTTFPATDQLVIATSEGGIERTVQRLADLRGWVDLERPDIVLSFVRLLTDDHTRLCGIEGWYGWEILEGGHLLGRTDGRCDLDLLTKIGWHPPEVVREGKGWRIRRFIITEQTISSRRIFEVEEVLTEDGHLSIESARVAFEGRLTSVPPIVRL